MKNVQSIANTLTQQHQTLSTAESCSGGLISHSLTNTPGSSGWFKGGIVAYANSVKESILDVPPALIRKHGAVSSAVALAMAKGARKKFKTDYALATTGIAGPSGGTPTKPVGLVFIACASTKKNVVKKFIFSGNRLSIKKQTASAALTILQSLLTS